MSDNNPDFDSMSPEELMAWMETLAERQGASEGFTTEKRMDIAEVDPNTVEVKDNYIPYGMSEDEWARRKAKEDEQRTARQASKAAAPPPVAVPPPPPVVEPVAAASAGGEPDFENMSSEELMAWMETLAERQGASEGFTTEKRMNIAEVDPDSVEVKDTYIPYGKTEEQWVEMQAKERAAKEQRRAIPPPPPQQPEPSADSFLQQFEEAPAFELPDMELPTPEGHQPAPAFDLPDIEPGGIDLEAPTETISSLGGGDMDGLAWLENLAAGQGDDFPQMDLSGLDQELQSLDLGGLAEENTDPLEWLDGLMQEQQATPQAATSPADDPEEDVDPLEWLESLAKQQGAESEELITGGRLNLPEDITAMDMPEGSPGAYTDYTFEAPELEPDMIPLSAPGFQTVDELDRPVDGSDPDDPVAWLEGLAQAQSGGTDTEAFDVDEMTTAPDADVISRLDKAEDVAAEDMERWMADMLERGASRTDVSDYIDEDEEDSDEIIQGNIPDWLVDQIGPPPEMMAQTGAEAAPPAPVPDADMDEIFGVASEVEDEESEELIPNIPDWLRDDEAEDTPDAVFATEEAPVDAISTEELLIDSNDPWVEAFEIERRDGLADPNNVPDWYKERAGTGDSETLTAANLSGDAASLTAANLPIESELPPGQPEAMPGWLGAAMPLSFEDEVAVGEAMPADVSWLTDDTSDTATDDDMPDWLRTHEMAQETAAINSDDMPDWLKETDNDGSEEILDWLVETISDEIVGTVQQTAPQTAPPQPTPAPASSPAPVVVAPVDVAAALQSAREKIKRGDAEGSLQDYEAVVRANVELDVVVADLDSMVKGAYKHNAAVYRVLGDGLMRQGRLQDALDTYRKALNLL